MIDDSKIELRKIQGEWYYVLDLNNINEEEVDSYYESIMKRIKNEKKLTINSEIMTTWKGYDE